MGKKKLSKKQMRNAATKEALRLAAAAKLQGVGDAQGGQHFVLPESVAHRLNASRTLFVHHCCRVYRLHSLVVYRLSLYRLSLYRLSWGVARS